MFQLNDPGKSWWFGQFKRCWGCYETRAWPSAVVAHSWIHIYQHLYSNIRKTPQFQCAFCTPEQLTAFTLTPPSLSLFCGEEAVCYRTDGFTYGNTGMLKAAEERSLPGLFFFLFSFHADLLVNRPHFGTQADSHRNFLCRLSNKQTNFKPSNIFTGQRKAFCRTIRLSKWLWTQSGCLWFFKGNVSYTQVL